LKILIIGCGGIGSWLVARLGRLRDYHQLNTNVSIAIADCDTVEIKNLPYQNFNLDEVMD